MQLRIIAVTTLKKINNKTFGTQFLGNFQFKIHVANYHPISEFAEFFAKYEKLEFL
jgi:hypothetical protein